MKNSYEVKYLLLSVLIIVTITASGQARLVLNGAHLVITNNATLVIENDSSNAITRVNGSIISEGEGNIVKWMMGQTTGIYTIPWSNGTDYLPFTFTKSAGTGEGNFLFSTYPTPPQNSLILPSGVTNLTIGGVDKSYYFIDRFWQMNAQDYAVKPSLTNVQFGYLDIEHDLPNTIVELALSPISWNNGNGKWEMYGQAGDADINENDVNVATIASSNLNSWWSLLGEAFLLPTRFLSFSAGRQGNIAKLVWKTANEINVLHFDVQKSVNGNAFISIARTPAYGASGSNVYLHTDDSPAMGTNAYRIKETCKNGTFYYSETRAIVIDGKPGGVAIYPNPVTGQNFTINATGIPAGTYSIELYGLDGKRVTSFLSVLNRNHVMMHLDKSLAKGMYLLKLTSGENTFSTHLLVKGN